MNKEAKRYWSPLSFSVRLLFFVFSLYQTGTLVSSPGGQGLLFRFLLAGQLLLLVSLAVAHLTAQFGRTTIQNGEVVQSGTLGPARIPLDEVLARSRWGGLDRLIAKPRGSGRNIVLPNGYRNDPELKAAVDLIAYVDATDLPEHVLRDYVSSSTCHGADQRQRREFIRTWRLVSNSITFGTTILALALLLTLPQCNPWLLLFPILAIAAVSLSRGGLYFGYPNSIFPSLTSSVMVPVMLALGAIPTTHSLPFLPWTATAVSIGFVYFLALIFVSPTTLREAPSIIAVAFLSLGVGYGAAFYINTWTDRIGPPADEMLVVDKEQSWLARRLTLQGREQERFHCEVTREVYERTQLGTTVHVTRHPGALGIPWQEVSFWP